MSGSYACKHCGAEFESRGKLAAHYRYFHRGDEYENGSRDDDADQSEKSKSDNNFETQPADGVSENVVVGQKIVVPWDRLPPEMRVLSHGSLVVLRCIGSVDHDSGGLVLIEIEVQ